MKTLFLTAYDDAFKPLGELTYPLMLDYATKHDFDFHCMHRGTGEHPSWWKMFRTLLAFEQGVERVIWMDADMVVTNPYVVPPGKKGLHCSQDWGPDATEPWSFSMCCWTAFPDCSPVLRWAIDNRSNYKPDFRDQEPMQDACKRNLFPGTIVVHPRRVFNAVPKEIHAGVCDPWQPGDWAAHLTMLHLPDRVKLFPEIVRQAYGKDLPSQPALPLSPG